MGGNQHGAPALCQLKDTYLWSRDVVPALQPGLPAAELLHYAWTELGINPAGNIQVSIVSETGMVSSKKLAGRTKVVQCKFDMTVCNNPQYYDATSRM